MASRILILISVVLHVVQVHGYGGGDGPFTYDNNSFYLHGAPLQIMGGQMDPQRVPPQYWGQRLRMARAMGLNTIFSNVFWDRIERQPGEWDFSGENDVATYFRMAQAEGLHVVLRPGPYVCAEHEWGGFPAWLSLVPGMVVRQNNGPFLNASRRYLEQLGQQVRPLQVTHGGPILMAQLENEYGSFGADKAYLTALRGILQDELDVVLYTNDGGSEADLAGGQLHGVLAETDGSARSGFAARDQYVHDASSLGPQLDGEYYVTWIDNWASNASHQTDAGNAGATQQVVDDVEWILGNNHSFSLYMFHGGTNWGLQNGGIWGDEGYLEAVTTSYDYGAPLDESGRPTDIYHRIRRTLSPYQAAGSRLPDVPAVPGLAAVPEFALQPAGSLFELLDGLPRREQAYPQAMEALGQWHGLTLYEHVVTDAVNGTIRAGDDIRDRIIVYVNGARCGVMDRTYVTPATVRVSLRQGDVLQLLVENLGRVDYGQRLEDQRKGIVGNVTIGNGSSSNSSQTLLSGWSMYSFDGEQVPSRMVNSTHETQGPVFYRGTFKSGNSTTTTTALGRDTFIALRNGVKGMAWVNGINVGRYWTVGPQQSLYVPGCYLQDGNGVNELVVLELEPSNTTTPLWARGLAVREWFNQADPDAPGS